jgi:hypothetical protein
MHTHLPRHNLRYWLPVLYNGTNASSLHPPSDQSTTQIPFSDYKHRWKSANYYEIQSALMAVLTYCDYRWPKTHGY